MGGFNLELFASEEIDLSKRLKKLARQEGKKIVILHRHPLLTSARKLSLYSRREYLRFFTRAIFHPRKTTTSREACQPWYRWQKVIGIHGSIPLHSAWLSEPSYWSYPFFWSFKSFPSRPSLHSLLAAPSPPKTPNQPSPSPAFRWPLSGQLIYGPCQPPGSSPGQILSELSQSP